MSIERLNRKGRWVKLTRREVLGSMLQSLGEELAAAEYRGDEEAIEGWLQRIAHTRNSLAELTAKRTQKKQG